MSDNQTARTSYSLNANLGMQRSIVSGVCLALLMGILSSSLQAAVLPNPRLVWCFPAGAQQGQTVHVTVGGTELDEISAIIFSHPGIQGKQRTEPLRAFETEPRPIHDQFDVIVAADVPTGDYEVRVLGRHGLSTPRTFRVGELPEVQCDLKNTTVATAMKVDLNTLVNCPETSGDSPHFYEFQAQVGKPVVIYCESSRIDSQLVAVLELLNPQGNPVAFGRSTNYRECVIHYVPTTDGPHVVKVHDSTFRGGRICHYRLEVTNRPFVEFVWPPMAVPGSTGKFKVYGYNLPGGTPAAGNEAAFGLEEATVEIAAPQQLSSFSHSSASATRNLNEAEVLGFEYRLPGEQLSSHPVFIAAATAPVVLEAEPNDSAAVAQNLTLPCEVAGSFFPGKDKDWFTFTAVKGVKYSIDVFSERLELPTDAALTVVQITHDAAGKEVVKPVRELDDLPSRFLNNPFDSQTADPQLQFVADAEETYRIQIRDLFSGAGSHPRNVYRMSVRKAEEDFSLVVTSKELGETSAELTIQRPVTPVLRQGACQPLMVQAYRRDGYAGPIVLSATGLPTGVSCPPVTLEKNQNQATLVLCAADDAAAWHGTFTVVGTAQINGKEVQRQALGATLVSDKVSKADDTVARVTRDLALAVVPEQIPLKVSAAEEKVWETTPGAKLPVQARFTRNVENKGGVKLEVRGLPSGLFPLNKTPTLALDQKVENATIEIPIPANLAPGDYPCYLTVHTQSPYVKNPEAIARAESQKVAFEAQVESLKKASEAAETARIAAEKQVADLTAAQANAAETGDSQAEGLAAANKLKAEATDAAAKAAEILKAAQAELPNVVKKAADLTKAKKPVDIELFVASQAVVIRVLELPLKALTFTPPAAVVAGGEAVVTVGFERLPSSKDVVNFECTVPAGIAGLSIANVAVPGTEQAGKLVVKTTSATPAGEYPIQVLIKVTSNGQALQSRQSFTVKVEAPKVAPAAAK